ncbi:MULTISPECIES: hypothetical protein [unclassified Ensifer]|uniref:hypothetical protein n=1 Tax=unclassified Ensifer TaxID=2633371 RepID=UPI0008137D79|nr:MULTISPECIES: hypothetical protein [unclassified Ensifer]OCP00735.1 hypothetical protein BC362_23760 [Ensifer sp. LC14]OCP04594.1 hypothetical protein BBX50_25245 [Ensifer sp. LC11]OCP09646.1 hypothetical protein BC374_03635 [Ensifer sp. LC13]OCP30692.1 hypothetical protein BC364_24925 [Ensifer sp. LC499]
MRFQVIGSRPINATDSDFEALKAACRDIGRELASRHHEVVLGSLGETTADRYVADGMKEVKGKHKLTFHRPDGASAIKMSLPEDKFEVTEKNFKGNRHINALAEGMTMLVIGGQRGTATAGFAAFALKRPVLALPCFGGAGKDIWDGVSVRYGQSLTSDTLDVIKGNWDGSSAKVVVDALEQLTRNNPFDDRIKWPQIFLALAALVMVLLWVFIFSIGPKHKDSFLYMLFFFQIGIASVIGTIARTVLNVYFDVSNVYSSKRVLSDFVIGIIMGFGFFLFILASGVLLVGEEFDIRPEDFRRLSVFMSLVTLAASFLLERSVEEFRKRIGKHLEVGQ